MTTGTELDLDIRAQLLAAEECIRFAEYRLAGLVLAGTPPEHSYWVREVTAARSKLHQWLADNHKEIWT
jgi:hypothetical protein